MAQKKWEHPAFCLLKTIAYKSALKEVWKVVEVFDQVIKRVHHELYKFHKSLMIMWHVVLNIFPTYSMMADVRDLGRIFKCIRA